MDGLKQAILDEAEKKLDQLVEDGELTQAEADEMLARLKSHIDDLVEPRDVPGSASGSGANPESAPSG